jgi:chromosome segregation ATPase
MDNLSKKLASNDKMLKTFSNKMESFSSSIKNQHSFNNMLKSQISQLASSVPTANLGNSRLVGRIRISKSCRYLFFRSVFK